MKHPERNTGSNSSQDWQPGQSSQILKPGLYVVATPIGNLRDITLRALDILNAADAIYAEDTRVTQKLLSAYGIKTKLVRCDAHKEGGRIDEIEAAVSARKIVAFVSDAGTPCISDPGAYLVKLCREKKIPVFPVSGANAAVTALSASGITAPNFLFLGFLANKAAARRQDLKKYGNIDATLVLYEAPQRVQDLLNDIKTVLGERDVTVAREITKLHETFYSGPVSTLIKQFDDEIKGEVVVLIAPGENTESEWNDQTIDALLKKLLKDISVKEAVAQATAKTGMPRKEIYARALALERE